MEHDGLCVPIVLMALDIKNNGGSYYYYITVIYFGGDDIGR